MRPKEVVIVGGIIIPTHDNALRARVRVGVKVHGNDGTGKSGGIDDDLSPESGAKNIHVVDRVG